MTYSPNTVLFDFPANKAIQRKTEQNPKHTSDPRYQSLASNIMTSNDKNLVFILADMWKYRTPVHNMLSWKYSFSQRNCYDLEVPWCCSIQNKISWVGSIFYSESSVFWEHSCENLYSETSTRDINPLCSSYSYKLLRNWPKKQNCLRTLCYNHFST